MFYAKWRINVFYLVLQKRVGSLAQIAKAALRSKVYSTSPDPTASPNGQTAQWTDRLSTEGIIWYK